MKVTGMPNDSGRSVPCRFIKEPMPSVVGDKDMSDNGEETGHSFFHNSNHQHDTDPGALSSRSGTNHSRDDCNEVAGEGVCNGTIFPGELNRVISYCDMNDMDMTDGVTEISDDSRSLPEVCQSNMIDDDDEDDDEEEALTPEVRQAYRIFHSFLLEKHKALTAPFWRPVGPVSQVDVGAKSMCFQRIDEKFVKREYRSITEFVADFRLMLENCYRFHGVDHWVSKQAQKLEIILEQKLTLLSRTLREKTTLAVTSRGRFGSEDEKGPVGTSTRRRSVPRNLAAITVGGSESIMVQALRLEEQQRAKEERRLREQEKKEAEEASAKEVEEWDQVLLAQADPWPIDTMWELPAIGHFLCLAQQALNLPEIIFFELERCLLMPRCSSFLAKVMTSLLCPPHRRATLHRRPSLPYRRWEVELRQRVLGWYRAVGRAEEQGHRAEQLGLCQRFFWVLGEMSPLEEQPFHLLPFRQRVWLLKGLCDNVYETQHEVQDAVLGQPIHECRESILGYDSQDNSYIHFPHFCGADLRVYRQSPCLEPGFAPPPVRVRKELEPEAVKVPPGVAEVTTETVEKCREDATRGSFSYHGEEVELKNGSLEFEAAWGAKEDEPNRSESEPEQKRHDNFLFHCKEEVPNSCRLKVEPMARQRTSKAEEEEEEEDESDEESSDSEPCLRVGEACYRGKSPAHPWGIRGNKTPLRSAPATPGGDGPSDDGDNPSPESGPKLDPCRWGAHRATRPTSMSPSGTERKEGQTQYKRKRRKKRKGREGKGQAEQSRLTFMRLRQATKGNISKATTVKKKDKRRKRKLGQKLDAEKIKKNESPQFPVEPTFKLVCTSLEELRELISKTEDELDELESTKKRSGRWFYKREAVKELHITLIRLLNELTPWEPKLVKAFQRNRTRLKKDYDDFRKHPEYDNFIREELVEEEEELGTINDRLNSSDISMETEEAKDGTMDRDSGAAENQLLNEPMGRYMGDRPELIMTQNEAGPLTRNSKRRLIGCGNEYLSPNQNSKMDSEDSVSPEPLSEGGTKKQNVATVPPQAPERTAAMAKSIAGFQGRCKPIQALVAKSVGNKVTLMSQSQAAAEVLAKTLQEQNKVDPASGQENKPMSSSQLVQSPAPFAPQTQAPTTTSLPKSPVQLVYNMAGGLGLLRKDGSQVKFAVQPVLEQKTGDKVMQQVVILPKNLLIQRSEEKTPKQPFRLISVPTSKTSTPFSNSGVTMVENKIPIQQVAPLKETSVLCTPSPAISPNLKTLMAPSGGAPTSKMTTDQNLTPTRSPATSPVPTDPSKSYAKQELKTVCIRDSQSIHVTTRGGNTGVVKVQTSNQSPSGTLPVSPVFSIPLQLQAFLVSKSPSAGTSTTPPSNATAGSLPPVSLSVNRSLSLSSTVQSPLKASIPVSSASLIPGAPIPLPLTQMSKRSPVVSVGSLAANAQTFISMNSQSTATSLVNISTPSSTLKSSQCNPQTSMPKTVIKSPTKRTPAEDKVLDQGTSQKFLLVTPSSNTSGLSTSSQFTTSTTTSVVPGSRVMIISQGPVSAYSAVTMSKDGQTSEPSVTSKTTAIPSVAMTVKLNLGQTMSSSALTKVQGISVPGLPSRVMEVTSDTSKNVVALTETATKNTTAVHSMVPQSSSSCYVQRNHLVPSSNNPSVNSTSPVKGTVSTVGKTLTFSTLSAGHMASSALLTAVQQGGTSSTTVSSVPSNRPGQTIGFSSPNVFPPSLGSLARKDTTLQGNLVVNNSQIPTPVVQPSSPIKMQTFTSPLRLTQALTSGSTIPTQTVSSLTSAPRPITTPVVRPPINPTSNPTTVQEKIVINTTAPLAPGTQILINNTRFVVPAQGLGPGSHVLLISSPAVPRGGLPAASPTPAVPKGPSAQTPTSMPIVIQGSRMVTPGQRPPQTAIRLPAPSMVKVGPSASSAARLPLLSGSATTLAQTTLGALLSPGQQGLTSAGSIPSLLNPGRSALSVATSGLKDTTVPSPQGLGALQNAATVNVNPALKAHHLTSVLPPIRTMISGDPSLSTVSMPPVSSTLSRIQTLPVATVQPIGSTVSNRQVTPVATVPPSINTVIRTPSHSIQTVRPGTIRVPVVLTNPSQGQKNILIQAPGSATQTVSSPCKLLVSPDGAILNAVQGPAVSSLPVLAKLMAGQVGATSSSGASVVPALNTDDSQQVPTQDRPVRPND